MEIAQERLANPKWRLNNLYSIISKQGSKVVFKLNWAQEELYNNMWYCNLILKARQLGISTFVCLLFLDRCLFNSNVSAGVVAHTLEDAQQMFRRVKYAYDCLPEQLRGLISSDNDTSQMLKFSNGSSLRVGTSLRSSTFQYLHISEFGKLCNSYPEKAREVITGSLNTLSSGQYCFIESTAEGREGYFFDMVSRSRALKESETKLTSLDFRFFFFPWWRCPEYCLNATIPIPQETQKYFDDLEAQGISLYPQQKFWYCKKQETQSSDMMREYPSTPDEAFHTSLEGAYYSRQMLEVRKEKRIQRIYHEPHTVVHTSWDLGFGDSTSIWFFQICGKEIHLIEYYENSGEPLTFYLRILKEKDYNYGKHLVPHDAANHEYSTGLTRIAIARNLGVTLTLVPNISVDEGIDAVRDLLHKCWFDEEKCSLGIKALESYRRQWNERQGCWSSQPLHNQFSHGCFVSDTLIDCMEGSKRICDIQVGDMVKTPNGYRKATQIYVYDVNELLEVSTTNSKFTCTPNHKIFTENGLIHADALRYNMTLYNNKIWSKILCRMMYR